MQLFRKARNLFLIIVLLVFQHCRESSKQNPASEPAPAGSIQVNDSIPGKPEAAPEQPITASLLPLDSANQAWLQSIRSSDTIKILLALNRTDLEHLFRQDTLVIPSVYRDLAAYSPFPDTISPLDSVRKIVLCSYPLQAFGVYENGKLIRWGPCSMGKRKTPTPSGLLNTNWKAKKTISTVDGEWILFWSINLDNKEGVSMHQYDLPGFSASHACIRLDVDDAKWMYSFVEQWRLADAQHIAAPGTPILVFGSYPFGKARPWRRLDDKKMMKKYSSQELLTEVSPFLDQIKAGQAARDSVQAARTPPTP